MPRAAEEVRAPLLMTSPSDDESTSITKDVVSHEQTVSVHSQERPSGMVILLALSASISGFMFGYDTGYISAALVQIKDDLSGRFLTSGDKEFITSATSLGALLGAVLGGVSANVVGRRGVLLVSNVIFVVGSIIQLAAKNVWTMIVGRFVMGWGVGCASLIAPLMLSELAPARYRGRLIVVNGALITGGQLVAYFINWGLERVAHGWRVSVGLCMVPAVLQFGLFWFLPDTPRFYVMNHDPARAKEVLRKVYNHLSDEFIDASVAEMVAANSAVPGSNPWQQAWASIKLIHRVPANFRALVLACGLQGIQQFTGFNSLMYFSTTIFETLGFDNPTATSIIIAATNFVFTLIAMAIIDIVGRRRILLFSMPTMMVAMIVCAVAFHYDGIKFEGSTMVVAATGINGWGIVIVLMMVLFVGAYAIGIGTSAWTGVELFSDVNVRAVGGMYATCTNWAGSLVIASTFLTMLENITPTGTFSFFGGLCLVSFFFVYFLLPETAGLELEETSHLLMDGFGVDKARQLRKMRKQHKKNPPQMAF
ncbi:myo-inositol transporter 1 [Diutina catenulata]